MADRKKRKKKKPPGIVNYDNKSIKVQAQSFRGHGFCNIQARMREGGGRGKESFSKRRKPKTFPSVLFR